MKCESKENTKWEKTIEGEWEMGFGWEEIRGRDNSPDKSPRQMYWLTQWLNGTSPWTAGKTIIESLVTYELFVGSD